MKKYKIGILALAALGLASTGASAATIDLTEYAFNINGAITTNSAPAGVNLAGFNTTTGLGTVTYSTTTSGYFAAFFDHEIDETINTFFKEYGAAVGAMAAGQSWEIDEPGFVFGDIYNNFTGSNLDNSNGVPSSDPDDVSMAMGWDFILNSGQTAWITLTLSDTAPSTGFYLAQFDPDSQAAIYFSGKLNITDDHITPEPATMLLMATGLTGLLGVRIRRKMQK